MLAGNGGFSNSLKKLYSYGVFEQKHAMECTTLLWSYTPRRPSAPHVGHGPSGGRGEVRGRSDSSHVSLGEPKLPVGG
jgi:hypothetical protein